MWCLVGHLWSACTPYILLLIAAQFVALLLLEKMSQKYDTVVIRVEIWDNKYFLVSKNDIASEIIYVYTMYNKGRTQGPRVSPGEVRRTVLYMYIRRIWHIANSNIVIRYFYISIDPILDIHYDPMKVIKLAILIKCNNGD